MHVFYWPIAGFPPMWSSSSCVEHEQPLGFQCNLRLRIGVENEVVSVDLEVYISLMYNSMCREGNKPVLSCVHEVCLVFFGSRLAWSIFRGILV